MSSWVCAVQGIRHIQLPARMLKVEDLLAPYQGPLLIACSGGADSTCLAHAALCRAKRELSPPPVLIYIDHGLRHGTAEEARNVKELAKTHGGRALIESVEVLPGASLERAARTARYAALKRAASQVEARWVLLGHTASDQAETVFMRIVRGTGLVGLGGIPKERAIYARPLLSVGREETEAYCREHRLPFVEDPMNRDHAYTRSRIRHKWLPALRQENPRIREALCRLGQAAQGQKEVLDWGARRLLDDVQSEAGLRVGPEWKSFPKELAIRALILHAQKNGVEDLGAKHLQAILQLAQAPSCGSRSLSLPKATVHRHYDVLSWHQISKANDNDPRHMAGSRDKIALPNGYRARTWHPGDRMRPARLKGRSRKLSDLFGDAKVPRELRSTALVIERLKDNAIVWVEHIGPALDATIEVKVSNDKTVTTRRIDDT